MAQRVFKMSGRKFYSIMDMARELGLPRIYARDFDKYGIVEITGTPEADEPDSPLDETSVAKESSDKTDDSKHDDKTTSSEKSDKKAKKSVDSSKKVIYTMDMLIKMSLEDFSKNLRKIDTSDIIKFAEENDIDTHTDMDDDRIRRMKVVMDLKKKYYPNQTLDAKKVSFKGVDLNTLLEFAKEKKVEYKESSDDKIQKMWVIYALNQAGYYDLPNKDGGNNGD